MPTDTLDLEHTFVQLEDGPAATPIEVGDDFWQRIGERTELQAGRLVMLSRASRDWGTWEMHPAGEELVMLLAGAVDFVLELSEGERVVALRDRGALIVPRGVWHTARVHAPSELLFITRGAGTQHRPV